MWGSVFEGLALASDGSTLTSAVLLICNSAWNQELLEDEIDSHRFQKQIFVYLKASYCMYESAASSFTSAAAAAAAGGRVEAATTAAAARCWRLLGAVTHCGTNFHDYNRDILIK
jgi:hypothetical protein